MPGMGRRTFLGALAGVVTLGAVAVAFGIAALIDDGGDDAAERPAFYLEARIVVQGSDSALGEDAVSLLRQWSDGSRVRYEIERIEPPMQANLLLSVSDGTRVTYFDSSRMAYSTADIPGGRGPIPSGVSALVGPTFARDLDELLASLPDARVAGEERVLGRDTTVVALGESDRVWIDNETNFALRHASEDGGFSAEVTTLNLDPPPFGDELFRFDPPPGSVEQRPDGSGSCSVSAFTTGPGTVEFEPGFFEPGYIPPGYVVVQRGSEGGSSGCETVAVEAMLREGGDDGAPYLYVEQRRRAGGVPEALRSGNPVTIRGGIEAYSSTVADVRRLVWAEGDVVASVRADALPASELVRVAESMTPS